eukprot:CAMPEP_0184349142 /NCGR_PEP_ID=MMETSP1089-20130417/32197_1 /TAXON_ID=38269 ORGANISM="Gloeochaete wittrockiana, Strain SAG46.84" /NCGR_SAMPLE_ID=MMETSP1089 /ASSEMBLY_ACC=CAM_ASM_000445 /LENGTH=296 /DNA_ID=CAMNT_0026681221 /DNA_START=131 /DNA_END=1021 /DNA_ORIENTATION=+
MAHAEQAEKVIKKLASSSRTSEEATLALRDTISSAGKDNDLMNIFLKVTADPISAWRLLCHISRLKVSDVKEYLRGYIDTIATIAAESVAEHFHEVCDQEEILDSDLYEIQPEYFLKIIEYPSLQMNRYHSLAVYRALTAYTSARSPTNEDADKCQLWPASKTPCVPQDLSDDAMKRLVLAIERFCPRHALMNCQCGRARSMSEASDEDQINSPKGSLLRRPSFRRTSWDRSMSVSTPTSPRSAFSSSSIPSMQSPASGNASPMFGANTEVPILDPVPILTRRLSSNDFMDGAVGL